MWTAESRGRRAKIAKKTKRYPSDLTDEEWSAMEPFLPGSGAMGRLRRTDLREVLNAICYENVQNAFDAIMLRRHAGQEFEPAVEVLVESNRIVVSDNGLGMTRADLRNHFWRAGSSKNTDDARASSVSSARSASVPWLASGLRTRST